MASQALSKISNSNCELIWQRLIKNTTIYCSQRKMPNHKQKHLNAFPNNGG